MNRALIGVLEGHWRGIGGALKGQGNALARTEDI